MKKIGILGGGVWGSALAKLLSSSKVFIFARNEKIVNSINDHKFNPKLKYAVFNDNVTSTLDITDLQKVDYLLIVLPSQNIREALNKYTIKNKKQQIIIASKGIEIESKLFLSDLVSKLLHTNNISILSGPCFSHEVAQNLPTAVTLASPNRKVFDEIEKLFNNKNFRLYFSDDIIGCQLGGALKNIYAIAAGVTIGLNFGENAKSALISRSFFEIIRLGKALKAKPNTLFGLSGLGDLMLTCNSIKSRNTRFGQLIASQQKISIGDHLKTIDTVEGYFTVKVVKKISEEKNINMPIMEAVYNILYNNCLIKEEIEKLLNRPTSEEYY